VSVNQFFRFARDVASWKLIEDEENFIFGGHGTVVQIDESVVTKRKYKKGRVVKEKWVLGMYDTSRQRGLVMHVPKRDAATLIPIIQEHVLPRTEIWTDKWAAYRRLSRLRYVHKYILVHSLIRVPKHETPSNRR